MIKKTLIFMISCIMVLSLSNTGFAAENVGVSYEKNWEKIQEDGLITTQGTKVPKSTYNIAENGVYNFSGQAAWHYLYTEKLLTGKTDYTISVYNEKGNLESLSFWVYKKDGRKGILLDSGEVNGQKTLSVAVAGLKTDDEIYIKFDYPSHFSGSVY